MADRDGAPSTAPDSDPSDAERIDRAEDALTSFFMSPPPALEALADEVRGLLETALSTRPVEPDYERDMAEAARGIAALRDTLRRHESPSRATSFGREEDGDGRPYYIQGPDVGGHNPVFPLLERTLADGVTTGRVHFGVAHEGPPGCVHGGVVALLFDQLLGHHILDEGIPGMTGTLTVRYLKPTPLYTDLSFRVETGRTEGRKMRVQGRLFADGDPTAEGEGLFILPRQGFAKSPGDAS